MSKITKRIKDALRPLVRKLEASRLAPFCAFLLDSFRMARYRLLGRPRIAPDDVKNVEENVTFIFKSFNRQTENMQNTGATRRGMPFTSGRSTDRSTTQSNASL